MNAGHRYMVTWQIDIWADSFQEAAGKALGIQRDPTSIATVFDVSDLDGSFERIDLLYCGRTQNP